MEIITLHDIEGITRKSGTDEYGNIWIEFEVDYMAEQEPGECCICGATLESGWLCLDGGDEACSDHIEIKNEHRKFWGFKILKGA